MTAVVSHRAVRFSPGSTAEVRLKEWEAKVLHLNQAAVLNLTRCENKVLGVQVLPGGDVRVTAGPYVGRLRLGSVDIVLQPKRPIPTLLTLLSEVHELTKVVPELADYQATSEVVDLLVQIFLRQVDGLVRIGLKRTYVKREEERVPVRGRLDVRRTFALHMRARPRVWCSFEEFTLDGAENRAMLATLLAIASNGTLLQNRRRVAHKLTGDFYGVSAIAMTANEVEAIKCDRLSAHYEPVLKLAQLILASMGLANAIGDIEANGFLLNMNYLFERFIFRRLRQHLKPLGVTVDDQPKFPFDDRGQAIIKPDLVLQSARGRRLVADTKYKDKGDPEPADLYQMLTYCRILRVSHGILITLGDHPTRQYSVKDRETTIEVVPVNLDGSVADIHASIASLAARLQKRLEVTPTGTAATEGDHL